MAKHSEIEESDSATKQALFISQSNNLKVLKKVQRQCYFCTLGFFIYPCLIWMSLFAFLGEPCSVFCSGKEKWDVYASSIILGQLHVACGAILWIKISEHSMQSVTILQVQYILHRILVVYWIVLLNESCICMTLNIQYSSLKSSLVFDA